MNTYTRRKFLQTTSGLFGVGVIGSSWSIKQQHLLSFSTLGCPDWSFTEILNFATKNKYQGIELRGIKREMDIWKCPELNSPEAILQTKKVVRNKKLKIVNLGTSTNLHVDNPAERLKGINDAKHFIDIADQLGCPYIRVFPNLLPKEKDRDSTIDLIVRGLKELGDYAANTNVIVLMETHGDVVKIADLQKIMELTSHPKVGLVWDIVNMWSVTKEDPALAYKALKKYIHHVHIKDALVTDKPIQYTLLGKGNTPIFEAIDILSNDEYKGYYSFEWGKLWHPEIEVPEIALTDYPQTMKKHFDS